MTGPPDDRLLPGVMRYSVRYDTHVQHHHIVSRPPAGASRPVDRLTGGGESYSYLYDVPAPPLVLVVSYRTEPRVAGRTVPVVNRAGPNSELRT